MCLWFVPVLRNTLVRQFTARSHVLLLIFKGFFPLVSEHSLLLVILLYALLGSSCFIYQRHIELITLLPGYIIF
jgi:hypothetical protein